MIDRRRFVSLASLGVAGFAQAGSAQDGSVQDRSVQDGGAQALPRRAIPRHGGVLVPVVGMGSWLTFDVPAAELTERTQRRQVLQRFFAAGGGMIDSSPMYGRAERLIGELLAEVEHASKLYTATKIWTPFDRFGAGQLEASLKLWRVPTLDLVLVHNLLNWAAHLKLLRRAKEQGRVHAIGISSSHGRDHDIVERVFRSEALDAIQITYNFNDTSAEQVMNLAAERGLAVVINRPFDGGALFSQVGRRQLPEWTAEFDCANWAQFFLKWVLAHPAVTCAIPATRNPLHMIQNMGAGVGRMPDAPQRRRMQATIEAL